MHNLPFVLLLHKKGDSAYGQLRDHLRLLEVPVKELDYSCLDSHTIFEKPGSEKPRLILAYNPKEKALLQNLVAIKSDNRTNVLPIVVLIHKDFKQAQIDALFDIGIVGCFYLEEEAGKNQKIVEIIIRYWTLNELPTP